MPTVPKVNSTGGGIDPQLDVLAGRMLNRGSGSTYNPQLDPAEMEGGFIPTAPPERQRPRRTIEQKAQQTVSLAELLAATRSLPASERAAMQRRILADPRAWERGEWLQEGGD